MPRRCNLYGCLGNYPSQPYTKTVSFPKDPHERERWILAMPNDPKSLRSLSEIHICASHFDCEWISSKGGWRPSQPPSVFPSVPKSCFKQVSLQPRPTSTSSSDARELNSHLNAESLDKIKGFESFCAGIQTRYPLFKVYREEDNFYISQTDKIGQKVVLFMHFKYVESCFGFLFLNVVEKYGIEVSKKLFPLQKNSLISRWSQIKSIINIIDQHEFESSDYMEVALEYMNLMTDCHDSPHFIFLVSQLHLFFKPAKGRRFDKNTLLFALQVHNLSHSAYRMIRKSGSIILPCISIIKNMLCRSIQDDNLKVLFEQLKPEQRLVNMMFDEVKLTEALRFSGGHILGYAQNNDGILASHAMVIEIACHYGGPQYVLRVIPCAKLTADQLKDFLLEAIYATFTAGGSIISVICDNCQTNRSVYNKLGGPDEVKLPNIGHTVFLVYDYVHIFKNIRNNWITVDEQKLGFIMHNIEYTACWSDIRKLYEMDRNNTIRMTRLTFNSIHPKPL